MKRQIISVIVFGVLSALIVLSGCKDDEPQSSEIRVSFVGKVGSENFSINQEYTDQDGRVIKFTMFKFYISDFSLIRADNSEVLVKDVELIDFDGGATSLSSDVDFGDFKGFKFGLGVSPEFNGKDPSEFGNTHPLGVYANTYWTWATQYRFALIEGRIDPTGTGNVFNKNFIYHTGTDPLYRTVAFPDNPITITAEGTTEIEITMDAMKVFYGDTDYINYETDSISHTTGSFSLAERITDNLAAAFN